MRTVHIMVVMILLNIFTLFLVFFYSFVLDICYFDFAIFPVILFSATKLHQIIVNVIHFERKILKYRFFLLILH